MQRVRGIGQSVDGMLGQKGGQKELGIFCPKLRLSNVFATEIIFSEFFFFSEIV